MYTKKTSLFFFNVIVITILSCLANLAFAQTPATSTGTTTSPEVETPQVVEEQTPAAPSLRDIRKNSLSVQVQTRLINLVANMSNRIDAVISRLELILKRAESRSQKLEAESFDMSEAQRYLTEAHNALNQATINMSTMDTQASEVITSDNPRELWKSIRTTLLDTAQLIKTAKESLMGALRAMKSAEKRDMQATTTATTEQTNDTTVTTNAQ